MLEGVSYINGSPQNTFVPGVMELAAQKDVFIAGDDFKSGELDHLVALCICVLRCFSFCFPTNYHTILHIFRPNEDEVCADGLLGVCGHQAHEHCVV